MSNQSQSTPGSKAIGWIANNQPITTISHSKVCFFFCFLKTFFLKNIHHLKKQICDVRDKINWTLVREKDLSAPYIYNNDKWIGFDDEISIKLKVNFLLIFKLDIFLLIFLFALLRKTNDKIRPNILY